jgi:hypothetical protein
MKSAVSVFDPSAFRLIHQSCFWADASRPSSRTPSELNPYDSVVSEAGGSGGHAVNRWVSPQRGVPSLSNYQGLNRRKVRGDGCDSSKRLNN